MTYPDFLTTAIFVITAVGLVLGTYMTVKIYSKDGFR